MIIAIDFDGTLCEDAYPEIGQANMALIDKLRACQRNGDRLILWTCRAGEKLLQAVSWCGLHGLFFDCLPPHTRDFSRE